MAPLTLGATGMQSWSRTLSSVSASSSMTAATMPVTCAQIGRQAHGVDHKMQDAWERQSGTMASHHAFD
eukprot:1160938-Pelagomonas_calceolata.AAC.14